MMRSDISELLHSLERLGSSSPDVLAPEIPPRFRIAVLAYKSLVLELHVYCNHLYIKVPCDLKIES